METTADSSRLGAPMPDGGKRTTLLRAAVPCVAVAGAFALVWAGLLSGGWPAVASILGSVLAVGGAISWEFRPRVGRWVLALTGSAGLAWSGAAILLGGSVPWLLVAFWGSVAVLLAAVLDIVVGPGIDRSATIAVVAVASLLLLSALGLGEYVRATWSPAERSMLEQLPVYKAALASSVGGLAKRVVAPVTNGEWGVTWHDNTSDPTGELARMRVALATSGWTVTEPGPMRLLAEKNGFVVELYESAVRQTTPATAASATVVMYEVSVSVHVGAVAPGAAQ